MAESIQTEPCLHPSVLAVYFSGVCTYGPIDDRTRRNYEDTTKAFSKRFPSEFRPAPDTIYNAALAGHQKHVYGPGLEAAGFKLVMTSINPNTDREINLYVLAPGDF